MTVSKVAVTSEGAARSNPGCRLHPDCFVVPPRNDDRTTVIANAVKQSRRIRQRRLSCCRLRLDCFVVPPRNDDRTTVIARHEAIQAQAAARQPSGLANDGGLPGHISHLPAKNIIEPDISIKRIIFVPKYN
ncbi:MAG: hypothetical protein LBJ47_05905 [Tannerella sp.]|nr:hypothetical protein [Tannerella sp.]